MVQPIKVPTVTGEWECMECGYIENGTESRKPARCPECSAPASSLDFFAYDDEDEEQVDGELWDDEDDEDGESEEEDEDDDLDEDEDEDDDR